MFKYIYKIGLIGIISCFIFVFSCLMVQAGDPVYATSIDNPITATSFVGLFVSITNWIAGIVASLAMLMVVIGGMQYIFSGGSEERVKKANKTIIYALVGLLVVGASWGLLQTLLEILGQKQ